jgi:hypothetical protein
MKKFAAVILMVFALATSPAPASAELEVYTASTTGELVIDTEGRVQELSLDRKTLGEEVMKGFEDEIRSWRFEPIVRDGGPVRAKAHMALHMVVIRQPGVDGLRLGFESVQFNEPSQRKTDERMSRALSPPHYPRDAMERGIGARVMLLLRLDDAGRVTQVATESVHLLGEEIQGSPARHARYFSRAAEQAAAGWQIPGIEGNRVVVPVRFSANNDGGVRWIRTRGVDVEVPGWVAIERAEGEVIALGDGGGQSSEGWKLLTPLDGA